MTLHVGIVGPVATVDVAHLLDRPAAPLPAGMSGAPILATLITEMLQRGHRVSAFTLTGDMPLRDDARVVARGPAFELHVVPARLRAWPMNGHRLGRVVDLYAFERQGLRRAIGLARPDVLHAHWTYEYAWAVLRTGLPHVVTCHDSPLVIARFQRDLKHGAYRWLRAGIAWHVLRHARRVTAVSPYLADEMRPLCRADIAVVPNPMPDAAFARTRGLRFGPLRVVMAANGWDARKNPQPALQAFAQLAEQHPQAELHLFGRDYGAGQMAQRWWHEHRPGQGQGGRVFFHGEVAHDAMLAALADSDLLLHPALEESFGAVPAEAMAMGVPVVAGVRSGAVPWVVGDAGLLVDVTQPDAMAAAMGRLADDPDFAARLGARGRAHALERFSASTVAARYEAEYLAALNQRTGRATLRGGTAAAVRDI